MGNLRFSLCTIYFYKIFENDAASSFVTFMEMFNTSAGGMCKQQSISD